MMAAKPRAKVLRFRPKTREEWLALRAKDITASTVSVLFGANPYQSVAELWAEKTGRIKKDTSETPAMRRGRLMEGPAVQILREERPTWKIDHTGAKSIYYRDTTHRLGATPDVIVDAPDRGRGIVQIKSVDRGVFSREWRQEDGTIEVPLMHALQASLEAALVPGAQWAAVGAQLFGFGGIDLELIEVPLMQGVIDAMRAKTADFWSLVESGKEPPLDFTRDAELVKALYPGSVGDITIDLSTDNRVAELYALREKYAKERSGAESALEQINTELQAKMGDHTVAILPGGKKITWRLEHRNAFTVAAKDMRIMRWPR